MFSAVASLREGGGRKRTVPGDTPEEKNRGDTVELTDGDD